MTIDTDGLRKLMEGATPGPWRTLEDCDDFDRLMEPEDHHGVSTKVAITMTGDDPIAHVWGFGWDDTEVDANAALIVALLKSGG